MIYEQAESFAVARVGGLGGTDVAAVVGVSPWRKPIDVFVAKTEPESVPVLEKELLYWGSALEPLIRQRYGIRFNCKVVPPADIRFLFPHRSRAWNEQTIIHGEKDWMLGTPDGLLLEAASGLEIKCSGRKSDEWGTPGSDEIPPQYLIQCMWYMLVTGYKAWNVAVLFAGNHLEHYRVVINDDLAKMLMERAEQFWNDYVLKGVPPPVDESESYGRYLARRFSIGNGNLLPETPDIQDWTAELKLSGMQIATLEERQQLAKNHLMNLFADSDGSKVEGVGTVKWVRPKPSVVTDYKAAFSEIQQEARKTKKWARIVGNILTKYTGSRENTPYVRGYWAKAKGE